MTTRVAKRKSPRAPFVVPDPPPPKPAPPPDPPARWQAHAKQGDDFAALSWVRRAVCRDATRFHLCGVYLDPEGVAEGRGRLVATDGHRMHVAEVEHSGRAILMPDDALDVAMRWAKSESQFIDVDSQHERLSIGDGTNRAIVYTHKRGKYDRTPHDFPPWQAMLHRRDEQRTITVDAKALRDAAEKTPEGYVSRTLVLWADPRGLWACFERNGPDGVQTHAHPILIMPLKGEFPATLWCAIDARYLKDALHGARGDVEIQFTGDELAPFVVRQAKRYAVIMPLRSSNVETP